MAAARSSALNRAPIAVRSALDREGRPLTRAETQAAPKPTTGPDEQAPWPDAEYEAAMEAELAARAEAEAGARKPSRRESAQAADTLAGAPLPELEVLMATVPATTVELLEDLFRAQFQDVRRVPAAVLKSSQEDEPGGRAETATDDVPIDDAAPSEEDDAEDI